MSVWSPFLDKDKQEIEKVKRRATRLVPGLANLCYEERLERFKMTDLDTPRRRGDLIQLYKIFNGMERVEFTDGITLRVGKEIHNLRGHSMRIRRELKTNRVVEDWNSLPSRVVEAKSVESFKSGMDEGQEMITAMAERLNSIFESQFCIPLLLLLLLNEW